MVRHEGKGFMKTRRTTRRAHKEESFMRLRFTLAAVPFLFFLAFGIPHDADAAVYVAAPPVIVAPDYIDSYCMPNPSSLPAQPFVSRDGYPFVLDAAGRHIYCVPASYAVVSPLAVAPTGFIAVPYTAAAVLVTPPPIAAVAPSTTYYIPVP
jgi:hypothetical protein